MIQTSDYMCGRIFAKSIFKVAALRSQERRVGKQITENKWFHLEGSLYFASRYGVSSKLGGKNPTPLSLDIRD